MNKITQTNPKYKVLIIAPAWVGDMVMSQTLFKQLYQQYQEQLELDVLVSSWASGLVLRMPEVHQILENPFTHGKLDLIKRIQLGLKLRAKRYDQVFLLANSFKSAITPFFAGIKRRTGFVGEGRYGLLNEIYPLNKQQLPLMIDRFCALANAGQKPLTIEWPKLTIDHTNQQQLLHKFNLASDQPVIAFCPAAEYGPAKRWPVEHFAKLADLLIKDGFKVLVLGSAKDTRISQKIVELVKDKSGIVDVCGQTRLIDAIDLLAKADHVVTNDSGLMHIACAVGSQVIAVYGSSSPDFTPPLSSTAQILALSLNCSPCFARTCRFDHYHCLKFITPEMVLARIKA